MTPLLSVLGLALAGFVSTSFDNFMILLGFLGDDEYPRRQVVGGYVASVGIMLVGAFALAQAVEMAPARFLGYLGLVPLSLGLVGLYRLVRFAGPTASAAQPTLGKGFLPVVLVMLANSGDSLSVFVSVFADTSDDLEVPVFLVIGVCALLYAMLARWLVTRSNLAGPLQRGARVVLPFLLIGIGAYILLNTGTDVTP